MVRKAESGQYFILEGNHLKTLYQIEVKRYLAADFLRKGWSPSVHLDPMEICRGGTHPEDKLQKAQNCLRWFQSNGVEINVDRDYGKADLVARKVNHQPWVIEVESKSSKLKSQALYSAMGQSIIRKYGDFPDARYGIAVPDTTGWKRELKRVPARLMKELRLTLFLVSSHRIREKE